MPKTGKKAGGGGGKKGEDGSLSVQQKAGTWETNRKEALLKEVHQRAQAEEERARQKEKILKDKLQKEERNSAKNKFKIIQCWVTNLRQAQSAERKEDMAVMNATFEREVEELDSIATDLEREQQEQERQSALVQHDHQQQMERLCDLHEKHMMLEHQQWESCMLYLHRVQRMGHSQLQHAELDDALFAMQEEHKGVMADLHDAYQEALKFCNEWLEPQLVSETSYLKKLEEDRKKHLEQQRAMLNPSRQKGDMKTKQKEAVNRKDMLISKRSEQEQQEQEQQVQELIAACDQVHRNTLKLKDQLSKNQTAARKKLTDLTVHSDATSKKLKALIAKGERIVQKGNICEKLESEVLLLPPPETAALGGDVEEVTGQFPELQNLMRRTNTAVLQGDALKKCKQDLIRENQELERQLHEGDSPQLKLFIGPVLLGMGTDSTSKAWAKTQTGRTASQGVRLETVEVGLMQ